MPDTTNEAASAMVKANLEIDGDIDVVRLVPKDKDISSYKFISFKIGLDPVLKTKALDKSTWREGIAFREFEDYGNQKFRKPMFNGTPLATPR